MLPVAKNYIIRLLYDIWPSEEKPNMASLQKAMFGCPVWPSNSGGSFAKRRVRPFVLVREPVKPKRIQFTKFARFSIAKAAVQRVVERTAHRNSLDRSPRKRKSPRLLNPLNDL